MLASAVSQRGIERVWGTRRARKATFGAPSQACLEEKRLRHAGRRKCESGRGGRRRKGKTLGIKKTIRGRLQEKIYKKREKSKHPLTLSALSCFAFVAGRLPLRRAAAAASRPVFKPRTVSSAADVLVRAAEEEGPPFSLRDGREGPPRPPRPPPPFAAASAYSRHGCQGLPSVGGGGGEGAGKRRRNRGRLLMFQWYFDRENEK